MLRKITHLGCFIVLLVLCMVASNVLLDNDTIIKAPLPTASNVPYYVDEPSGVLVPLQYTNQSTKAFMAQNMQSVSASGSVMTVKAQPTLRSYGGGAGISGGSLAYASSRGAGSSVGAGSVSLAVPQVVRKKAGGNKVSAASAAVANPLASASSKPLAQASPRKASMSSRLGESPISQQPIVTPVSGLSLGYASAAEYINRGMFRAPGDLGNTESNGWDLWVGEKEETHKGDAGDGKTYVSLYELYEIWLNAQDKTDMPGNGTWEEFLAWFYNTDKNTKWVELPLGDAVPFLVLLGMIYILLKRKQTKQVI